MMLVNDAVCTSSDNKPELLARRSVYQYSVSAIGVHLSPIPSVGLCMSVRDGPESVLWQNG